MLAADALLVTRALDAAPNYDEGVYLASLDALRDGERLGDDVFASQPPGFYSLLELLATLGADATRSLRLALLAVSLLGVVAAYAAGRALLGRGAGLAAAALLVVAPPLPTETARIAADAPAVALVLVAIALAAGATVPLAGLAGASFAAAVSVKLLVLPAVIPVAALLVRRDPRRSLAAAAAGALIVTAAVLAPHVGALPELWEGAVSFHGDARATLGGGLSENVERVVRFFDLRTPFAWLVIAGAAIAVSARPRLATTWPLWAWAASCAAFLVWHRPLLDHHFTLLAAALALPAGMALGTAAGRSSVAAGVLVLALAAGYVQELRRLDRNDAPQPLAIVQAAERVRQVTSPDARIITDLPIVAHLADRRVPGDLVDTSAVRLASGSLTDRDVLRELGAPSVEAAVIGREFRKRPRLMAAFRAHFDRRRSVGDVEVYD